MEGLYGGSYFTHMLKHYRNAELWHRAEGDFELADYFRQLADLTATWSFEELSCQVPRHALPVGEILLQNPLMRSPWEWGSVVR